MESSGLTVLVVALVLLQAGLITTAGDGGTEDDIKTDSDTTITFSTTVHYNNSTNGTESTTTVETTAIPITTVKDIKETCTEGTCKNGGECSVDASTEICKCLKGTSGYMCEIVDDCVTGKYKECVNEKGSCSWNGTERVAVCTCDPGKKLMDISGYCEVCDCGKFSSNCSFINDKKVCNCEKGYSTKNGMCEETCFDDKFCENGAKCDVGKKGDSKRVCECLPDTSGETCGIVDDCVEDGKYQDCEDTRGNCSYNVGKQKAECTCGPGRQLNEEAGYCKVCFCGNFSISCGFVNNKKVCTCKAGYLTKRGRCEECNCGEKATECKFDDEQKVCECEEGYADKNGTCWECGCGQNSTGCRFNGKEKVCLCKKGYADDKGKCEDVGKVCKAKYPLCSDTHGTCVVDDNFKVDCVCTVKKSYVGKTGCAVTNETCDEDRPNCRKTKGKCDANQQNQTVCECPKETVYTKDTGCTDEEKLCMDERPMCLETQGSCDVTHDSKVICVCHEKKDYVREKGCEVLDSICDNEKPKCRQTNGYCNLTAESDVMCACEKGKEYNESVGCAVNKCKSKCGVGSTLVLCEGDPFGEDVSCKCKDHKMDFIPGKKICKYGTSLSGGSIAGIVICVLAVIVLVSMFILHRRKAAVATDDCQARFRGDTIAFESALYNANYESLESNNSQ